MPSRADMDRPASVTAALIGVVLIAITLPYFLSGGAPSGANEYTITWSQVSAASQDAPVGTGSPQTLQVPVRDQRVSNITIEVAGCTDSAQQPLQQPAVLTFTLKFENQTVNDASGRPVAENDVSCQNAGPFVYAMDGHPDVASMRADSAGEAERDSYGAGNRTGTYQLTFSWNRPPGTIPNLPIPVGQPVFTGAMAIELQAWHANANTAEEVPQ
jgi:hypothetical protein